MPQVKAVIDEILCKRFQELRVGSGIGRAEIVDWVHEAAPHQMKPNPVGLSFCKKGIARTRHPVRESHQFIGRTARVRLRCSKKPRLRRFAGASVLELAFGRDENNLLALELVFVVVVAPAVFKHLVIHAREDTHPVVIIILRPAVEWVIVALRALHPRPQE